MASYYVYSGAVGTGTGADWTNAFTTLGAAVTGKAAGDIFYLASDHAEAPGAATVTLPGTFSNLNQILSVSRAGSVPPVAADLTAGASIAPSATYTINGSFYAYGLSVGPTSNLGFSFAAGASNYQIWDTCTLRTASTSPNSASSSTIVLRNTVVKPVGSAANTLFTPTGKLHWIGGSVDTSSVTITARVFGVALGDTLIQGVDFSAATSLTAILSVQTATSSSLIRVLDCKLPAGVPLSAGTPTTQAPQIMSVNADSGSTNYLTEYHSFWGDVTTETTIIRTGGASDGTTGFSRKAVMPASGVSWASPLALPPIAIWNDVTGSSVTATVHATSNLASGAFPNNDDVWIEVLYLGDTGDPKGLLANNTKSNILAAGSAYTTDGATWGGSPTGGKFAMPVTFTPQKKGYIYVTVKCAKTGTTFYVDPLVVLS